jgi:hypothetical protein
MKQPKSVSVNRSLPAQNREHNLGYNRGFAALIAAAAVVLATGAGVTCRADDGPDSPFLEGRVVAAGIPGISAIAPVGTFLPGGPIHDKPAFAAYTQPGRVLDPARLLVGSTSNFGESLANADQEPGSFISIDPSGSGVLVIPPEFAAAGGQASALGGFVQMYSAQNPAFLNSIHNASAATAGFTGVSNPLGLSINNAFGRLWPANAPYGLDGIGSSTILDPTGEPLAGAPDPQLGGVYADALTPRLPAQVIPGALNTGAVGTALLGRSPDGSGKAVFAVVCADGSIVQESTLKALDGLVPPGTISPLLGDAWDDDDEDNRGALPRVGVLLNYSPTRILYVSEPFRNSIAVLDLSDDGVVFHVAGLHRIDSWSLNQPVDLAPVTIETSDPNWAANTTLDVQADFYVANRGDNTIVRMRQDGSVVAVRGVRLAGGKQLGNLRLNGIAGSADGTTIWVTVTGHVPGTGHLTGAVLELPAF